MLQRILLVIISLFSFSVSASAKSDISGSLSDEKNIPIPYANIILINKSDSSIIKAVLTDEDGKYKFEEIIPGEYCVMVAQLGYEKLYTDPIQVNESSTDIKVNDIVLASTAIILQEANVTAMKPFIEHKIDRTIVNVENSIVNAGASALEILQRSPGIMVDNDGNIMLKGKSGVLVMMDDKPTYLSQRDLYELLRNMSSDQLALIEIITNPSAKYDAAGTSGIINIKLRKKQEAGFNGRVQVSYGQGVYPDAGGGVNLNYGNKRLNVFAGYDYFNGFYYEEINLSRKFVENGESSTFEQHSYDKGHFINNNFRGGADYSLSKKHSVGVILKANQYVNHDRTESRTDIYNNSSVSDSGYVTYNSSDGTWKNTSGNLNYRYQIDTAGRVLTADADFARYKNSNDFIFETEHYYTGSSYTYTDVATDEQPATISIRSFKADYVHPLAKSKIEAGMKTSYVKTDNDVKYYNYYDEVRVLDTSKTNHFKYTENINAAYVNWSGEYGKLGLQAGLRIEQTIADGEQYVTDDSFERNYIQLFPSTFLSYKLNTKNQFNISYSRRISRPEYGQLNPFKYFIDPYNYMEGNPNLEPQMTNSFELSYTYNQLYNIAFNFSHTQDAMTQITKQIDSIRTTFVTTENLDSYDNYGVSLNIPVKVTEWLQSSNDFNLFNNRYQGISSVGAVSNRLTSYRFNSTNNFSIAKGFTAELTFWYNSEMVWGTWLVQPQYNLSCGFSKMLFSDRLQLRLNLNDIFHTEITDSKIKYENIDAHFKRVYDSQFFRIHVSYKFGKQTQRARMRTSGAQEEQDRVKQGR